MILPEITTKYRFTQAFILSILTVSMLFALQSRMGLSLGDEGFLWYGAQRVLQGEIPILDFMSYDPGRYYWSAGVMDLIGDDGIISLRLAISVFQVIGLFIGVWLLSRECDRAEFLFLVAATITLALWMYPRHKLFDITISIMLVGALTYLLEKPSIKRYFLAGLSVGIAASFGRNHGLYGAIGSLGVISWIATKFDDASSLLKGIAYWVFGITVAYLPIIVMIVTEPGFLNALVESVQSNMQSDTYIPLSVPWPWLAPFGQKSAFNAIRIFIVGVFFIVLIAAPLFILLMSMRKNASRESSSPIVIVSAFLAVPYSLHAYSHADVAHLAQAIHPLLIGCLAILAKQPGRIKWLLTALLCGTSIYVMQPMHLKLRCDNCTKVIMSGDDIKVDAVTANNIAMLRMLRDKYAPDNQSILVAPFWPGAYSLLRRKSAVWEIYALFPRDAEFQQSEIRRIKESDPAFVLIKEGGRKGGVDLNYRKSHPLIHKYIVDNYNLSTELGNTIYKSYSLYVKR